MLFAVAACCRSASALAEVIRTRRRALGLTQRQLAAQMVTTQASVSYWETGKGRPSLEAVEKLARVFQTSIEDLLGS